MRGEFRERMEGFDGLGFNDTREDLYYLSRLRLNATITPARLLSFQVQGQDARVARKTVGPTGTPFRAPFDMRMAFADVGNAQSRVAVRVGRQELVYGEQRLVGHVGWLNAARTFDAAKLTVRGKRLSVDVFGASVVRILEGEFDKSGAGNRFAGAYATAPTLVPGASVEPYAFWKRDVNLLTETATRGTLSLATMGVRWVGRLPAGLEYNTDTALQTGSLGTDDVSAWAGHYTLRTPAAGSLAFRTSGEFNYASGDSNPADGTRGTFDQLYPTPHDKYGLADQVGWRNIRHLRAGIELTPWKGLPRHRELSLVVAQRKARCALRRRRRGARPRGGRRRVSARRAGARHPGDEGRHPAAPAGRGLRAHLHRRLPEGGDAGRVLQPTVRHGDLRIPRGEVR